MAGTCIEVTVWVKHNYIEMFTRMKWISSSALISNDRDKPYMRGTYRLLVTSEQALQDLSIYCSCRPDRRPHAFFPRTYAEDRRRLIHIRTTPL